MQYTSTYFNNQFPEHEILKCPRCESFNTKFCYYNNYNLSQPRHYCKNCKRYWTKGGTLRNVPVGGASRKITKRSSSNAKKSTTTVTDTIVTSSSATDDIVNNNSNKNQQFVGSSNSISSASYLINSLYNKRMGKRDRVVDSKVEESSDEGRFGGFGSGDMNCWSGSNNDWSDLAIFTSSPGDGRSTFQG